MEALEVLEVLCLRRASRKKDKGTFDKVIQLQKQTYQKPKNLFKKKIQKPSPKTNTKTPHTKKTKGRTSSKRRSPARLLRGTRGRDSNLRSEEPNEMDGSARGQGPVCLRRVYVADKQQVTRVTRVVLVAERSKSYRKGRREWVWRVFILLMIKLLALFYDTLQNLWDWSTYRGFELVSGKEFYKSCFLSKSKGLQM